MSVTPVFAVRNNVREYYDRLSTILDSTGAQTVTLQANSNNLIEAIQDTYEV